MRNVLCAAAFAGLAMPALAALDNTPPPADLLPPGAASVATFNGLTTFTVGLSPEKLDSFYRAAITKHGYTPAQDVRMGGSLSFYFSKTNGQRGSVVFTPKGKKTSVMLTFLSH